jgi:hypothetical protein
VDAPIGVVHESQARTHALDQRHADAECQGTLKRVAKVLLREPVLADERQPGAEVQRESAVLAAEGEQRNGGDDERGLVGAFEDPGTCHESRADIPPGCAVLPPWQAQGRDDVLLMERLGDLLAEDSLRADPGAGPDAE